MNEMDIVFGLHLDGQRAMAPADRLGFAAVGPMGMLGILETQLGLCGDWPSLAERVAVYRDCLLRADHPGRFYHDSFVADPLGTAATLLNWRDLWYLHGWEGNIPNEALPRLADLAEVERVKPDRPAPSIGERLGRVETALNHRRPPIARVRLADASGAFPKRWQAILAKLPVENARTEECKGSGFLGDLQRTLIALMNGAKFPKIPWKPDGSVLVVRAETRFLAGAWLASMLGEPTPTLLVSTLEHARLDEMFAHGNVARHGLREASAFRPALQVLSLALELLWRPLNLHALIQFLTHPISPIPAFARRKLAAKVAERPGMGGEDWARALEEIECHYAERAPGVRENIRFWLEHPRYDRDAGAPVDIVLDRVRKLADFFRQRLGDDGDARRLALASGQAQCRACVESLNALRGPGATEIRPRQLERLLAQATAQGSDNPLHIAEVGAHLAIQAPGAAIEPAQRVVWWQLTAPAMPAPYPWSRVELEELRLSGVALPTGEERYAALSKEWLRPVLAARAQLVLVLPPQGEEVHPLWQMIVATIDKPQIEVLEGVLNRNSKAAQPLDHRALPAARRWWQLPADVPITLRTPESFSSIEAMLFCPYRWLLKHPARLRPSRLIGLGSDARIFGNLAHQLAERLFALPSALEMSESELREWFSEIFPRLVEEEGAILLMPGRGTDLENLFYRAHRALQTLREHLKAAGAVNVAAESRLDGRYPGGELTGYADLVATTGSGNTLLVDMKWSGSRAYSAKLTDNAHLQLAMYAEMLRQKNGAWPAVAYFIISHAELLAQDRTVFVNAHERASKSGEGVPHLWQRFLLTWAWRKRQFEEGAIEVVRASTPETEQSLAPEGALTIAPMSEDYNDYRFLAGWGA